MRHRHTRTMMTAIALCSGAAGGFACSNPAAQCSAQSKLINGSCRASCSGDQDCLASERCDPTLFVCMAPVDSGLIGPPPSDAGRATDGPEGSDALEVLDTGRPDARMRRDSGMEDTGLDSGLPDKGFPDTGPPDQGFPDTGPPDSGVNCGALDEISCRQEPACAAHYCVDCNMTARFNACTEAGAPPPPCPVFHCTSCSSNTTERGCRFTGICHPIFVDQGNTMVFDHCASPATTTCQMPIILCPQQAPVCLDPYVTSYTQTCYEGCVTPDECG